MSKSIKSTKFEEQRDIDVLKLCQERKLSVSSVKYSRGHDGDCMNCNLKVGTKIVGTAWDDSWGGYLDIKDKSSTVSVAEFEKLVAEVVALSPSYTLTDNSEFTLDWCIDSVIDVMINHEVVRKDCAKKTVVMGTMIIDENARKDTFIYSVKYDQSANLIKQIEKQMSDKGYVQYEILNDRLVA
jgi:hypothetical protein